jgi:hypothetical protein
MARQRTQFPRPSRYHPVSLAKGPVDGASLGHAHLGTVNQPRDIVGIRISISNKPSAGSGLVRP